ncbi:EAL domain-containing protein [Modestobacter sp. NPDC049651]|uniref:putative bifunctional diguanylate cyclase/phosphodiesterase n=1 Tax=unclassified Modestobacter TaxID=2643866 RepID=UPI003411E59C
MTGEAALLVVDLEADVLRVSWANDQASRVIGRSAAELRGLPLVQLLPDVEVAHLRWLFASESSTQLTVQVARAAGGPVEAVLLTMPEPGGRRWTVRIISTANELQRALQASADAHERRFAAVTERSPVPLLLSEQGMRLAHVNEAFCHLAGAPAEQLLGTGWLTFIDPHDADRVVDQVASVLEGSDTASVPVTLARPDGDSRQAVLRLSRVHTPGVGVGFVGTLEDITERLAFEARLVHQAEHDTLTDLPNRTHLARWMADRFVPGTEGLACLFLDVDDFKLVNDSLGHGAGDVLLKLIAERLHLAVRPDDLVVRFGGDEFVVVCGSVTEARVVSLAERLVTALAAPVELNGVQLRPSVSVGVMVQTAEHTSPEDLIRDCDIALSQAKAEGKGRAALLDQRARTTARDRLALVSDLRDGIEQRALQVWYQPILAAQDGRLVAVEALSRWEHPTRGLVSPEVFVPLAETSGLIGQLGLLVLDETCRQLAEWDCRLGPAAPRVGNVNVSALQLDATLPALVAAALDRHGLQPGRLSIELTESALMGDPAFARGVLQELRDLGVHLAIDDFGTGYSSLAYLRHLPVDCLKVDRSFVADLASGGEEIAAMVIALARTLGLTTVAEGVETTQQADELARLGVSYLQGFFLARPMSGAECTRWFAARREEIGQ